MLFADSKAVFSLSLGRSDTLGRFSSVFLAIIDCRFSVWRLKEMAKCLASLKVGNTVY